MNERSQLARARFLEINLESCYNPAQQAVVPKFGGKWLVPNHLGETSTHSRNVNRSHLDSLLSKALSASEKPRLARILAERLHARRIYDCEDNPFLADFYAEKAGAAFRAQMYFLMERQKRLREGISAEVPGLVISDFSDGKRPDFRESESG